MIPEFIALLKGKTPWTPFSAAILLTNLAQEGAYFPIQEILRDTRVTDELRDSVVGAVSQIVDLLQEEYSHLEVASALSNLAGFGG